MLRVVALLLVFLLGAAPISHAHERPDPFASDFEPRNCSRDDDLKMYIIENMTGYYQGSDEEFLRVPFSKFIRHLVKRRKSITDISCKFSVTVYHIRDHHNVIGITEMYYTIKYEIFNENVSACIHRDIIYDPESDLSDFYKPISLCLRGEMSR